MTEDDVFVCDCCGFEFWKQGMGPPPKGWWCLACQWGKADGQAIDDAAEKLLDQVWPE